MHKSLSKNWSHSSMSTVQFLHPCDWGRFAKFCSDWKW